METLADALTLACPPGYVRVFADEGAPMAALLGRLIAAQRAGQAAAKVPLGCLARLQSTYQRHGGSGSMTHIDSSDGAAVLVRAADAEVIGFPPQTVRLLADSSATGGRLSTQRVTLASGADGANPHHHASSAELFYVLSGSAQLLAGDRIVVASEGDLALVPPGRPHAFAAAQASDADLLIVITPGVERFEYFRHLARIATGRQSPESLLEVQALYDTFFDDSPAWRQAPGARRPGSSDRPDLTSHAI